MDHDDWIRPDLLYRYELALRLSPTLEDRVLYCNEYKINERDEAIASSFIWKPEKPVFPYLFINYICHCLLVPRDLFFKAGKLRPECDGAQDYDLCLRLDLAGASFQNVPFFLYAWRIHSGSTAKSSAAKDYATPAGIRALGDYVAAKGLDWEDVGMGYYPTSYHARPRIHSVKKIHAIIPYKDNRELTLKAVESLLKQGNDGFTLRITCVDNGSLDSRIADELRSKGVEVLASQEPFNYSRINNLAVKQSCHQDSQCLFFMNNDVELNPDALAEMVRWIDQPLIGMVGCRLHYPDQTIQHGGVELSPLGPTWQMEYRHRDVGKKFLESFYARTMGVSDAVTAACVLVNRAVFLRVGGFDEVFYPIAYSDTDLARRFAEIGYYCLYNPFAFGVHHESKTRGESRFEEMERSSWMCRQRSLDRQAAARQGEVVFAKTEARSKE
jgi:GT2 family glycosyltransferase